MTESAATSTVDEQGARLLRPSARTLAHLGDTIRGCQDALSGFLDDNDSALANSSEAGSMSAEAAVRAVKACLTAATKAWSRPVPVTKAQPNVKPGPAWTFKAVKEVKEALFAKLGELVKLSVNGATNPGFAPTPNRVCVHPFTSRLLEPFK